MDTDSIRKNLVNALLISVATYSALHAVVGFLKVALDRQIRPDVAIHRIVKRLELLHDIYIVDECYSLMSRDERVVLIRAYADALIEASCKTFTAIERDSVADSVYKQIPQLVSKGTLK